MILLLALTAQAATLSVGPSASYSTLTAALQDAADGAVIRVVEDQRSLRRLEDGAAQRHVAHAGQRSNRRADRL